MKNYNVNLSVNLGELLHLLNGLLAQKYYWGELKFETLKKKIIEKIKEVEKKEKRIKI